MNLLLCRRYSAARILRRYHSLFSLARYFTTPSPPTPLRILYCGSDEFSAVALEKLHEEHLANPELIASIDVVCKAGKPSGRGMRGIRHAPIKSLVERLELPLHEIPTFTGWQPPTTGDGLPINLVIAISFGLLVPPRILNHARFGGLNLHPSLLPELHGPAPLQHTLLTGLTTTGITLQTLHPTQFDAGQILAQTHFRLPSSATTDLGFLRDFMAPRAADLLLTSLRARVFEPPLKMPEGLVERPKSHAGKIGTSDRWVDWKRWGIERVMRVQKAVGPVWSLYVYIEKDKSGNLTDNWSSIRVIWHNLKLVEVDDDDDTSSGGQVGSRKAGMPVVFDLKTKKSSKRIGVVRTTDGVYLSADAITIEGKKRSRPGELALSMEYLLSLPGLSVADSGPYIGKKDEDGRR